MIRWSILVSILASIPSLILALASRFPASKEPELATGSVPAAGGLPGEPNAFQPANPPMGRGGSATTAEGQPPPIPI